MSAPFKSRYVHSADEVPSGEHWAIITGESIHIPGDERSRTNPGHGYPESTEKYVTYEAFTDETEFKAELLKRVQSVYAKPSRGIHVIGTYKEAKVVNLEEVTR